MRSSGSWRRSPPRSPCRCRQTEDKVKASRARCEGPLTQDDAGHTVARKLEGITGSLRSLDAPKTRRHVGRCDQPGRRAAKRSSRGNAGADDRGRRWARTWDVTACAQRIAQLEVENRGAPGILSNIVARPRPGHALMETHDGRQVSDRRYPCEVCTVLTPPTSSKIDSTVQGVIDADRHRAT
jgi:hypothetical protein